jgi:flagellar hook protein FlgE
LQFEHELTLFFVREPYRPREIGSQLNQWTLFVQVDGQDVGDPNPTLPPAANLLATQAGFTVQFDEFGQMVEQESDTIHISNWTPADGNGVPNGALGPLLLLEGAILPVPNNPIISSNFIIDLADTTMLSNFYVFESALVNAEWVQDDSVDLACGAN